MATNDDDGHKPGEPSHIHLGPDHGGRKFAWLPWLLLALGLLALLFALSRCGRNERAAPVVTNDTEAVTTTATTATAGTVAAPVATGNVNLPDGRVLAVTPGGLNEQVGGFLAGTEATPRTFEFDRLNFDTGETELKANDREDLNQMAQILQAYPNSRVRIVGYADARGTDPANRELGLARANSIKQELVARGVGADRVETASGGENDPVATNATAAGQAMNRRTEVVIVSR